MLTTTLGRVLRQSARLLAGMMVLVVIPDGTRARDVRPQETQLRELNDGYVRAFMTGDAAWYDAHITANFTCVLTNGHEVSRAAFLENAAKGPGVVTEYVLSDVSIRIHGDAALVGAVGNWKRKDGTTGRTRYIDVWVKTGQGWKAASAQLTAVTG